jgi:AICAR transformylase/IMP cyclohydrolase PurH
MINYRIIIISQKCYSNHLEHLNNYIIYEDDNKLLEKAFDVSSNYEKYIKEIYGNKTNKEIFKDIENDYNIFYKFLCNK